jgi:hypothetical protein
LLRLTIAASFWSHANKELIAASFYFVVTAVECEFELGHVFGQNARGCDLRHRAMK